MNITEATIHQLIKATQTSGQGSVQLNPRASALPVDQVLTTLCTDLLSLYSKTANSYGTLGVDPTLHTFPVRLREYVAGTLDFQAFTTATLGLIARQMEDAIFSNGGYAMFLRYEHADEDFVLICMLKLKPGAGIDEATLSLQPTLSIDLGLLHEAARINLARWNSATEPYLSFIKGRAKKGDVTDYFRDALACLNFTSSSHHTSQLIKAADDFVMARPDLVTQEAKVAERSQMRKRLYDSFAASPDEVSLTTLAAAIMPSNLQDFIDYVRTGPQAEQYQINDTFAPHKKTYSGLRRISAKIGASVTVGFDVADVAAGRVYYDAARDGIVLKSPPAHLRQAIEEYAPAPE